MRLRQYTDYSLRVLIYLALHKDERSTIKKISDAYDIPRSHVMKVVQQLSSEGYVDSVRGQGGGVALHQRPEDIQLGALIRTMEDDFALVECFRAGRRCAIDSVCVLPGVLKKATEAFFRELDQYTLADLLPEDVSRSLIRLLS